MSATAALAFTSQARGGSAADDIDNNDAMCRMHCGWNSPSSRARLARSVMSTCRQLPSHPSGVGAKSIPKVSLPLLSSSSTS